VTIAHTGPLIFLTGETGVDAEARALELGALAYMSKPFEPTAFALLVTGVLARFARRNGPSLDTALRRAATVTSVEPGTAA
jgi:DNA-binding response OmpR family regulator